MATEHLHTLGDSEIRPSRTALGMSQLWYQLARKLNEGPMFIGHGHNGLTSHIPTYR